MIYATQADFIAAFGELETIALTNLDDPTSETLNTAVLLSALTTASREIDSYLQSAGYGLPLAETPLVLVGKCSDIARYRLDRNRTREEVRQRYLDAIFWLKDLAKGIASLGLVDTTTAATADTALPEFYTTERQFTFDSLSDY